MGVSLSNAHPIAPGGPSNSDISNSNFGPIPGESNYYNDYRGVAAPFPANDSSAIPAVSNGSAGPDDLLFQNLLSAEWAIYSFYQQGVEAFTADDFTDAGYPNTTYDRIQEIRDNEAGHLRIFQDQISNSSLKPGSCKYDYGFHDVTTYLAIQTVLEISSMAFLTGLVLEAQTNASKGALLAIAETETRHEAWSLIDIWKANPFGGPSDTAFPYANQILDFTNVFIIPDSCPAQNPTYPYPRQNLPQISYNPNTTTLLPGSDITFIYKNATNVPAFSADQDYYAVFFHGLDTISVPYNLTSNSSVIPSEFEQKGLIIAVIADEVDAPTEDSVVAGPLFIMEQVVQVNSLD
ncbi:hypothetical protein MMC28_004923 [Mycoblastus sanguinarius]|nr:hypothetical protein [Mycoblastus sanguinarius]